MENIFENAYFGKPYKTRDGRMAIYIRQFICNGYKHLVTTGNIEFVVDELGNVVDNTLKHFCSPIVSEWQEPINKEELKEFARHFANDEMNISIPERNGRYAGYMAGYSKAKQEQLWKRQ